MRKLLEIDQFHCAHLNRPRNFEEFSPDSDSCFTQSHPHRQVSTLNAARRLPGVSHA